MCDEASHPPPERPRFPHPLRWASIWFIAILVAYVVSLTALERERYEDCVAFRSEEAPAAFASFVQFLGERFELTQEEIDAAAAEFNEDLETDLPVSAC